MQGLAEQVSPKVSAQAISKYEAGKMMPSCAVLIGLGKALCVSLDFLMSSQIEALEGISFRKHSGVSSQDRAKAEVVVIEALEDYLVIEDILEMDSPEYPFGNTATGQVDNYEAVDRIAGELRREWKVGMGPISSMTRLLEEKGIKVVEADLPDRFGGLACEVRRRDAKRHAPVIVMSGRTGIERKRFNLAHELSHCVIRATGNPQVHIEKAMDRFAGAFLVPTKHLAEIAGKHREGIAYGEIIRLKHLYGVSAAAMLMRLGQADILPQTVINYAFRSYARKWRTEEPEPIRADEWFGTVEHPRRFEHLVWRALGERLISPVRAAQLLHQPFSVVERELRGVG